MQVGHSYITGDVTCLCLGNGPGQPAQRYSRLVVCRLIM